MKNKIKNNKYLNNLKKIKINETLVYALKPIDFQVEKDVNNRKITFT